MIMKILVRLIAILIVISCKAQTIIPIYGGIEYDDNSNFYLKDIDNEFNKYEGLWKFQEGSTTLQLRLFKLVQQQDVDSGLYEDHLLGECSFAQNGVILMDTLPLIEDSSIPYYERSIASTVFINNSQRPACFECNENERRIKMSFYHPTVDDVYSDMVLRYYIENGEEKLKMNIWNASPGSYLEGRTDPLEIAIPDGEYTLTKQ